MPKLNRKALTEKGIERLRKAPAGKRTEISDALAPGLVLRVTDTGAKSCSVYYRWEGKNTRLTLGPWPGLGIDEARVKAREVREWARKGIDPKLAIEDVAATERAEVERRSRELLTFSALAKSYIERATPRLARGHEYARTIERELIPAWRDTAVKDLRRRHLTELTDKILDRGTPAMAFRVDEIAKTIMNWAVDRGDAEFNPFAGKRKPVEKVRRDRVLNDDEIRTLWPVWQEAGYPFGYIAQLLLLTGQRRSEVAEARWSEFDLDSKEWIIPPGRTKSDREHLVPLAPAVVDILEALPRFDSDLLFTTNLRRPVSGFSKAHALATEQSGITGWTYHDLRRTCRTRLAALGVPEIVAGAVLNHARPGVGGIYNRHDYKAEKRDALERWANRLNLIRNPPENVVQFGPGAA